MNHNQIIEKLKEIASDPNCATDHKFDSHCKDLQGKPIEHIGNPPATLKTLERVERQLGHTLPELLRRIYLEVGDGGFGPGYGLLRLEQGDRNVYRPSVLEQHVIVKAWGGRALIPLAYWGCVTFSYTHPEPPHAVYIADWSESDEEPLEDHASLQAHSLEDFFVARLAGKDVFINMAQQNYSA